MDIKNLKINQKIVVLGMLGALGSMTLTGCNNNHTNFGNLYYNKAIIFRENTATIIEIKNWSANSEDRINIETENGISILTSSYDTKLVNDSNSEFTAEDIARIIGGEEIIINYLDNSLKNR